MHSSQWLIINHFIQVHCFISSILFQMDALNFLIYSTCLWLGSIRHPPPLLNCNTEGDMSIMVVCLGFVGNINGSICLYMIMCISMQPCLLCYISNTSWEVLLARLSGQRKQYL